MAAPLNPAMVVTPPALPDSLGGISSNTSCMPIPPSSPPSAPPTLSSLQQRSLSVGGYCLEGISIGGQQTSILVPSLRIAFDIGRCPQRAIFQNFLFITHGHIDHVGGLPFYTATRRLFSLPPPTVVVPPVIKSKVSKMLKIFQELEEDEEGNDILRGKETSLEASCEIGNMREERGEDKKESECYNLVSLDISASDTSVNPTSACSDAINLPKSNCFVRAFRTCHVIPSQGYLVYSRKKKLKSEYVGLPSNQIRDLRASGTEISDDIVTPEIAFTGDTTIDFLNEPGNEDVRRAKVLIMEVTFISDDVSIEHARKFGHIHLKEVVQMSHKFENEFIVFIHFSPRYSNKEILSALQTLPEDLKRRVHPFLIGRGEEGEF